MTLDRSSIRRSDFPTVRRGYDPAAVDAHLSEIAEAVERQRRTGGPPVAAAASEQVRRIVEAAEASAEQLRAEAGEEAREHVHRVSTAARELLERIGAMHEELGELMDRLREDAGRLSAELRTLERDASEVGGLGPADLEGELDAAVEAAAEPAPAAAEVEAEPAAAEATAAKPDDDEAARLVALDMALSGTPREETERYLAEHYSLAEPEELLDDVYSLAGQ